MPDGSTLGSDLTVARVLVDIPNSWPSIRPSITIAEPGPYEPGQTVTVEVRDHNEVGAGLGIAWCFGGETHCQYKFSSYRDGVHRVKWDLPPSSGCGTNRCYFAIDSQSEGLLR